MSSDDPQMVDAPVFLESAMRMMQRYDVATYEHLLSVGALSSRIAVALDLRSRERDAVRWAGLLHDFGKIGISRLILNAPRPLTQAEWQLIKLHPENGAAYARKNGEVGLADVIGAHHERIDGGGYPWGLSGTRIPIGARIIAVADTFDVLTSGRPYRESLTPDEAVEVIFACGGTQFDPDVVDALVHEHVNGLLLPRKDIA